MPLPKYYCDYCDRSFNDIPTSRKKHFESKHHKTMVKLHYDSYRDPADLLGAEQAKRAPCRNLLLTGKCEFGPNCRFSHAFQSGFPDLAGGVLPQGIKMIEELPPSMLPPPLGGYSLNPTQLAVWGR
eukprot:TRINITY_DN2745_c0_g1_i1.p1 TRINITY_DN2745_c0_g1~~TRINITY_DN2745_c0_g1_i1.p1  ORF type:complete len:127 (+),score=14.91 TRINITY_DN2745_c0_g1_i1:60-440(+)